MVHEEAQTREPQHHLLAGAAQSTRQDDDPMNIDRASRRHCSARRSTFKPLFIEELGWDNCSLPIPPVTVNGDAVHAAAPSPRSAASLSSCVQARSRMPDYAPAVKIEHAGRKTVHEHLIIYTDTARDRADLAVGEARAGQAARLPRAHAIIADSPARRLIQKLEHIAFTSRTRRRSRHRCRRSRGQAAFDVERVTKKLLRPLQAEHAAFLEFIKGITAEARPRVVRLADAQPADVRLLHPEEGLPRRRHELPPQPAEAGAGRARARTSSSPSTATSCSGCSTRAWRTSRRARKETRRAPRQACRT